MGKKLISLLNNIENRIEVFKSDQLEVNDKTVKQMSLFEPKSESDITGSGLELRRQRLLAKT
jgi:hypothetical protein